MECRPPRASTFVSTTWTLWDGTTRKTADVPVELTEPGQYTALLRVVDDAGLTCTDAVSLVVFAQDITGTPEASRVPPSILSTHLVQAECGVPAAYEGSSSPIVFGTGPFTYTAQPFGGETLPDGLSVDASTGALHWTPTNQSSGTGRFILRFTGPGGTALTPVELNVSCADALSFRPGCGCQSASSGAMAGILGLFAAAVLARGRASRARP